MGTSDIGYWTSSTVFYQTYGVWNITYSGYLTGRMVNYNNGVRPVITVPKNKIS